MGKKSKTGKARRDKYYHLAKESGLRARSAFKLLQLNRRFDFLSKATVCIDLCAAPGGWMQVAKKAMTKTKSTLVVGVDLVPIQPVQGCIGIQADITTDHCRAQLRKHLNHAKADVVLHDGAPNVGSAWIQDAFSQSELVLQALKLATVFLRKGGTFVSKVFRSRDYHKLMYVFGKLFDKVHATKPSSSRDVSAEIFVICQRYLAPHSIDPRLLDPRTVFSEVEEEKEEVDVFQQKQSKKPKAHGYEDGNYTQYKAVDVDEFIRSNNYMTMLAEYSAFTFSPSSPLLKLPETTEEIKTLCEDLKLLNKKDFRTLVKWRKQMRKWLSELAEAKIKQEEAATASQDAAQDGAVATRRGAAVERHAGDEQDNGESDGEESSAGADDGEKAEKDEGEEDDGLAAALKEAAAQERAKLKRQRRRRMKLNDKLRERLSLQLDTPQGLLDDSGTSLFNLRSIQTEDQLKAIAEGHADFDMLEDGALPQGPVEAEPVDERPRYVREMDREEYLKSLEDQLDANYNSYLERKNVKIKHVRHGKKSTTIVGDVTDGKTVITAERTKDMRKRELAAAAERMRPAGQARSAGKQSDDEAEEEEQTAGGGAGEDDHADKSTPLVKTRKEPSAAASRWLAQVGIDDMDLDNDIDFGDDDNDDRADETSAAAGAGSAAKTPRGKAQGRGSGNSEAAGAGGAQGNQHGVNNGADAKEKETLTPHQKLMQLQAERWAEELGLNVYAEDLEPMIEDIDTDDEEKELDEEEKTRRKADRAMDILKRKKAEITKGLKERTTKKEKQQLIQQEKALEPMVPNRRKGAKGEESKDASAAALAIQAVAKVLKGGVGAAAEEEDVDETDGTKAKKRASRDPSDPWFDDDDEDAGGDGAKKSKKAKKGKADDGFEEVPLEKPTGVKPVLDAHGLALATEMVVRNKKRAIIDAAYNRYAHNDGPLPSWFEDEEKPHMQPMQPVTKDMVNQIKEYERELNARPIKKVMEAKAKRKHKLMKMMGRVNQQASAIADNENLTEREKVRQIEQLYKKLRAKRNEHQRTKLVVARKATASKKPTRPKGVKGRYKMVDRRMMADRRGEQAAQRKKKERQKRKHR